MTCLCPPHTSSNPHCPDHGIGASLAQENEFFSDYNLREEGCRSF